MARRKHSGELNIGSDSFLDVIANIVGILIILIVIAGIRSSRAPVIIAPPPKVADIATAEPTITETPTEILAPANPVPADPLEPEFVEATEPPTELTAKVQDVQTQIDKLEAATQVNEEAKRELEVRQSKGELRVAAGRNTLIKGQAVRETRIRGLSELQTLLVAQKNNLQLLQSQLEEQKKRPSKVNTLKHRVTPISRVVVGEQLHFRLNGNQISRVPIQELLQAAMRRAKSHGPELMQQRAQIGTAGPISGYLLQYKLEAIPASAAETARHGPGMMRIALTSFQLEPDQDLVEESAQEALTRGSIFDIAIQTAEPGSTFTLWVYPDSFSLYRQLQARLHEAGFTIAARPLPNGIPIAGSPDGSASAGQ